MNIIDKILNFLKVTLVRFRKAKFGFMFFINIFKLPDLLKESRVSIMSKAKVIFALIVGLLYLILGIDFIPEIILGLFGFIDDLFILIWSLGIINEEIEKYKVIIKTDKNSNIIEDVNFNIKD
ncbi:MULTISPECIES: YkvA family protein [Romboutsia]|uniref:DUF1232 domain-containing protein n=1 Tax=Romboutsia hominis TaxID=1507512 RepID=A0A2P2BU00_9FIRM|nr:MULTISPECIES: DUF1232 domain-containing protein [Romboutsia]MCH1961113.1 DUF1232 domain-containing protein [Romboutsia hominis]MCH1968462.1 DUF1232 domain-containing protein [Romboutsia hominis]MDB8792769.1 DUF1232 domain-containing protein [Romboutsia sp. 1001216sp1]MDB8795429.1 DUF1232 domain-containing protein [Romboutsia sp. 1001216sp1]MDB8799239.1 DUF1232 domain-containing protein [Romboutsia sp. 1001216sp1]